MDIRVVHNGIDTRRFTPGPGDRFPKPTVLYLGRLKHYKKVPRLVSLMPRVLEQIPEAELVVAGGGEDAAEVEAEVSRLNAGEYVRLLGYVGEDEKTRLYQQAWVVATPSTIEGWGLTVMEASACGTPSVAFDVPGLNESILHGKSGLLARDEDEFVAQLVKILEDAALRETLSRGALEWSGSFSWEATAQRTLEVLEETAGT